MLSGALLGSSWLSCGLLVLSWARLGFPGLVGGSPGARLRCLRPALMGSPPVCRGPPPADPHGNCWARLGSPGLFWVLLRSPERFWGYPGTPGLSWALLSSPQALPGLPGALSGSLGLSCCLSLLSFDLLGVSWGSPVYYLLPRRYSAGTSLEDTPDDPPKDPPGDFLEYLLEDALDDPPEFDAHRVGLASRPTS
jgi:hypothetical protein